MNNKKQPQGQEIKITDNIPGAEYANAMQVHSNKDEFQLMFLNLFGPSGRVASKIITNPGHFKKMITVMNNVLKAYEDKFGTIEEIKTDEKEIGFKID